MATKKVVTFLDIANNNDTFDVGESVAAAGSSRTSRAPETVVCLSGEEKSGRV
jgi:hypothetical protein